MKQRIYYTVLIAAFFIEANAGEELPLKIGREATYVSEG